MPRAPKSAAARAAPRAPRAPRAEAQSPTRRDTLVFAAVAAAALLVAWRLRFVQDDAFISFIYARDLAAGRGLTWFGDRVEGYTNFLWVVWIALGLKLGVSPVAWAWGGSLVAFAAALVAVWRAGWLLLRSAGAALLAVVLLAVNFSTLAYATGGLETMLQTALLALALPPALRLRGGTAGAGAAREALALSCLLAAAVLTRLDSALPGAVIGGAAVVALRRRRAGARAWAALLVPLGAVVGAWLVWKLAYYGTVLPNSYQAKVGWSGAAVTNGLRYVGRFLGWYLIWPWLAVGAALGARRRWPIPRGLELPAIALVLWLVYVAAVGGDFMEFRFLVPAMPWLGLVLAHAIHDQLGRGLLRRPAAVSLAAVAILTAASAAHAVRFRTQTADGTLDSVPALANFYGVYPDRDWSTIGRRLRADLAGTGAVIALHPVGAIPYYSELPTVDMLGLNDRWVAAQGAPPPPSYRRPGHRRHAPLAYLRRRSVTLVIGHPTLVRRGALGSPEGLATLRGWLSTTSLVDPQEVNGAATIAAMPVTGGRSLLMLYLTPSPAVDAAMRRDGWESLDLDLSGGRR